MKKALYFSHDYSARNDPKLQNVLMKLGHEGKSVYWDLIEMLFEQGGYLALNECESYAFALRTHTECITSLINDFGLFSKNAKNFWSPSALRRIESMNSKSNSAKKSAEKRWHNHKQNECERNANASDLESERNANASKNDAINKINKIKEIKEIKEKENRTAFVKPSREQVSEYFFSKSFKSDSDHFFDYYESNGWRVGKNKMKRWDLTANNWERNQKDFSKNGNSPKETTTQRLFRELDNVEL